MLEALRRGDRIVTSGGIIGLITKVVDANELMVEIADGVRVRVARAMISSGMARTEPGRDDDDDEDEDEEEERPRSRKKRRRRRQTPDDKDE